MKIYTLALLLTLAVLGYSKEPKTSAVKCDKNSSLLDAAYRNDLNMMECIINTGVDVNIKDKFLNTALSIIVQQTYSNKTINIISKLLDSNASMEHENIDDNSPLEIAAIFNNYKAVEFLLKKGANVNASDYPYSITTNAANAGAHKSVELLVAAGGKEDRDTLFDQKNLFQEKKMWQILKDKEIKKGLLLRYRKNDLFKAIYMNDVNKVAALIKSDNELIESRNFYQETPLCLAVDRNNLEIVALLLNAGAKVNSRDMSNNLPITLATINQNTQIISLLLDKGANLNSFAKDGLTPLSIATYSGNLDLVSWLHIHGADINLVDEHGGTPYLFAEFSQLTQIADYLLKNGANINHKSLDGYGVEEVLRSRIQEERLNKLYKLGLKKSL